MNFNDRIIETKLDDFKKGNIEFTLLKYEKRIYELMVKINMLKNILKENGCSCINSNKSCKILYFKK